MISGNWNDGVNAGSRCVNANNYPWNVNTNNGVRLACDFSLLPNKDVSAITDAGTVAFQMKNVRSVILS